MASRSASTRKNAVEELHKAWRTASQRERAAWVIELRAYALQALKSSCDAALQQTQQAPARHNT